MRKGIAAYVPGAARTATERQDRGAAPRSFNMRVIKEISDSWAFTMPWASFFSTPTVHVETQPSAMWMPPL